ncbi:zinc metallochaperone AztD [Planctomonas psychrotolerans]|uniref:zinc metallochaperone AztD n=1 Tax=Planctomonas psychrotolerans TaxID=2528712 RepID=UPI0029D418E8|nr:zinc metallochaperone AztD [Planctomonas psychrotolerans]
MPSLRSPIALAAVTVTVASLAGCAPAADDRPLIVASTNILGNVVEELVGDQAEVLTLMKPNADPHSFEISAKEAARMRSADLIVSNGLGLEEGLQQHLDAAEAGDVPTFVAGDVIDVLDYSEGDAAGMPDSHFWTDPGRMLDVVDALSPVIAELDGVDATRVETHSLAYRDELDRLDAEMADAFAAIPRERRALVTNHHVFGYLAQRFDFEVVGAVIPGGTTLAAPSASDLADLVTAVEETGVPAIFAESSSPDRLVQALASEANVHVEVVELFTESLTEAGGGAPDYLTMMRANTQRITTGLSRVTARHHQGKKKEASMRTSHLRRAGITALAIGAVTTLAACSSGDGAAGSAPEAGTSSSSTATSGPRLAVAYEGGIVVLDGETLEPVADVDSEEFTRLNPAGDDRHVMVTMSEGFQVLDTGAGSGDDPVLTDLVFSADAPGHVVRHGGKTVLYADGTSDTTVFDTADLASDAMPETETIEGVEAHHGVSVILEDGTFLTTVGNADGRNGITVQDASGAVVAQSDQCPGVHGEGTAANEAVVFGCENGALVYSDGEIVKLDAPDQPYGRMGNAYVSETSPIVVGDYKDDPDAEGYLLSAVTVIDTAAQTLEVVELPDGAEYTFRDIARGPDDLAYILGSDGSIHVLDPAASEIVESFPVIEAWEGPVEWQDPHPAIVISGSIAYVTEPAANSVHAVDLTTGDVVATGELDVTPNEIAVAAG